MFPKSLEPRYLPWKPSSFATMRSSVRSRLAQTDLDQRKDDLRERGWFLSKRGNARSLCSVRQPSGSADPVTSADPPVAGVVMESISLTDRGGQFSVSNGLFSPVNLEKAACWSVTFRASDEWPQRRTRPHQHNLSDRYPVCFRAVALAPKICRCF